MSVVIKGPLTNIECIEMIKFLENSPVMLRKFFEKPVFDLLNEYKINVREQLNKCFGNIRKRSVDNSNYYHSDRPIDIFAILNTQMEVCKLLPPKYIGDIGITCLQSLREMQQEDDTFISMTQNIDIDLLLLTIGDNQLMSQYCEEFCNSFIAHIDSAVDKEMYRNIGNHLCDMYILLNQKIIIYIAKNIVKDFEGQYVKDWIHKNNLVEVFIATIEDYLNNIISRIDKYYFPKLLETIMGELIDQYIINLLLLKKFNKNISENVSFDLSSLVSYFKSKIESTLYYSKLKIFDNFVLISRLISGGNLTEDEFTTLKNKYNIPKKLLKGKRRFFESLFEYDEYL